MRLLTKWEALMTAVKKCGITKHSDLFKISKICPDGYSSTCKECSKQVELIKSRTKKGVLKQIYYSQLGSSRKRGMPGPEYSKEWLIDKYITDSKFVSLHSEWVASGYDKMKKPSVDRINPLVGYTVANIQIMTWAENKAKGHSDSSNGTDTRNSKEVSAYDTDGKYAATYHSRKEAARQLSIDAENINAVVDNCTRTTGGYQFRSKKVDSLVPLRSNNRKRQKKAVVQIDDNTDEILAVYEGITDAEDALGVSHKSSIRKSISGKYVRAYGYKWRLLQDCRIDIGGKR